MIIIYCDFQLTQQVEVNEFTRVAKQIQDYIPLRQFLRRALDDEDNNYSVYVQHPILALWLDDLRDYGLQVVRWEEINLREQFLQKFGFSLPSELDEIAIPNLRLLNLPTPDYTTINDPSGWLLGQTVDPIWQVTQLYPGHLADLSAWVVRANQVPISLIPLVRARLQQWIQVDNRYQIFLQCAGQDSWLQAGEKLLLRWALQFYPLSFHLRQELDTTPLENCSSHSTLCCDLLKKYDNELKQFWGLWLTTKPTSAQVAEAVKWMSGIIDIELITFEQWAQQNSQSVTTKLVDNIRDKFSLLPQIGTVLRRIESLVSPPSPEIPNDSWATDKWLNWATDEYMPYFAWVIRNRQPRDFQIELANRFADWMVHNYPKFLFSSNPPIITSQLSRVQQLLDSQEADVVLWFIIDGLTWWQGKRLANIFTEVGMGVTEIRPTLSALPSVTSISKRAIVQGYLDRTITTQPISQILRNRFETIQNNIYVSTQYQEIEAAINSLTNNSKPTILALLYNALDEQNHHSSGFTDDESVDGHLKLIASLANKSFQQCLQRGLKIVALVISDHGSTLLPAECPVIKLPNFALEFNDDVLEDEVINNRKSSYQGTRSCAINNTPSQNELSNLAQDWYYLASDLYNLPQDFLIPKSYAAVNRRPGGWTHGGATPEETIVSYIELQPTPVQIISPVVKIEGNFKPNQVSTLQVLVENLNPVPLRKVRLEISNAPVNTIWSDVPAFSKSSIEEINVLPASHNGLKQTVEWFINCEAVGKTWQFSGQIEVAIRRFQVNSVDELFDDL